MELFPYSTNIIVTIINDECVVTSRFDAPGVVYNSPEIARNRRKLSSRFSLNIVSLSAKMTFAGCF